MKQRSIRFLCVFFLLLALPALTIPLFRNSETTENRTLAAPPALRTEQGLNPAFFDELDDWLSDHIGFRGLLAAANARWQAGLLRHSPEEDVTVGRDGWLFYTETLPDYLNEPTVSPRGAACAAHALSMLRDYAESNGAAFAVAVVPNKSTVYPDRMPAALQPAAQAGSYELLLAALEAENVPHPDLAALFSARPEQLYQRTDSHWTYRGAYLAHLELLRTLGLSSLLEPMRFTARTDWRGDLAAMVYGVGAPPELQEYPDYPFTYAVTSRETNVDALRLTTSCETGVGSAVIYRDSFYNTAQVFAAEEFASVLFSRAYPYQAELIASQEADVCILEIVERNIPNLLKKAPVMPAPAVTLSGQTQPLSGSAVCFSEQRGGMTHLYGTLPEKALGSAYRVYLCAGGDCYEAFPCFEQELLGAEVCGDNGFSLYLESLPDAPLSILVETDGTLFSAPLTLTDAAQ